MGLAERFLHKMLDQEREKFLSEMSKNPVESLMFLLGRAGVKYSVNGNEIYIITGGEKDVSIKVELK